MINGWEFVVACFDGQWCATGRHAVHKPVWGTGSTPVTAIMEAEAEAWRVARGGHMRPLGRFDVNGKRCTLVRTAEGYELSAEGFTRVDVSARWLSDSALESGALVVRWDGRTLMIWEGRG